AQNESGQQEIDQRLGQKAESDTESPEPLQEVKRRGDQRNATASGGNEAETVSLETLYGSQQADIDSIHGQHDYGACNERSNIEREIVMENPAEGVDQTRIGRGAGDQDRHPNITGTTHDGTTDAGPVRVRAKPRNLPHHGLAQPEIGNGQQGDETGDHRPCAEAG